MTKYREILRLISLGHSQQNIAVGCNVSKKQSIMFWNAPGKLTSLGRLMKTRTMLSLQRGCFLLQWSRFLQIEECLTSITSVRSSCATAWTRSFFGPNTWRNVASPATRLSCIHSSATPSNRMSRNGMRIYVPLEVLPTGRNYQPQAPAYIIEPDTGQMIPA